MPYFETSQRQLFGVNVIATCRYTDELYLNMLRRDKKWKGMYMGPYGNVSDQRLRETQCVGISLFAQM